MTMLQTPAITNQRVPGNIKKEAVPIADRYSEIICADPNICRVSEVAILGSFGMHNENRLSDMDVWVTVNPQTSPTFSEISSIYQQEINLRRRLSQAYNYPNLARHGATVLTLDEALLYREVFPVRVGLPYLRGEHLKVYSGKKCSLEINEDDINSDLVVSLEEFIGNYEKSITGILPPSYALKNVRRLVQEVWFYKRKEERLTTKAKTDEIIQNYYGGDYSKIIDEASEYVVQLKKEVAPEKIEHRNVAHKMMWTLEKVRWELLDGYVYPEYFHRWRLGEKKQFGYSPREFGNLILQSLIQLNGFATDTTLLGKQLISISRSKLDSTAPSLDQFHSTMCSCLLEMVTVAIKPHQVLRSNGVCVLPTTTNKTPTITRIGLEAHSRSPISEAEAISKIDPQRLISTHNNFQISSTAVKDLNGENITIPELEKRVKEYADVLKEIHSHKVQKFGRLGGKSCELFDDYRDYLSIRINASRLAPDQKQDLLLILNIFQDELDFVTPVLCHMDPGPRNVIIDDEGNLQLIDFEHASGCAREYDLARVLMQLPDHLRQPFEECYWEGNQHSTTIQLISDVVMSALFAVNLPDSEKTLQKSVMEKVRTQVDQLLITKTKHL